MWSCRSRETISGNPIPPKHRELMVEIKTGGHHVTTSAHRERTGHITSVHVVGTLQDISSRKHQEFTSHVIYSPPLGVQAPLHHQGVPPGALAAQRWAYWRVACHRKAAATSSFPWTSSPSWPSLLHLLVLPQSLGFHQHSSSGDTHRPGTGRVPYLQWVEFHSKINWLSDAFIAIWFSYIININDILGDLTDTAYLQAV